MIHSNIKFDQGIAVLDQACQGAFPYMVSLRCSILGAYVGTYSFYLSK